MARTILVPLDATSESATVLDTVRELARIEGATVRLLHVAPPPEAVVNDEGQVIAYADQETDRVEHKVTVHERKRATLQDLFQTLLHQLMTAQIRVHHLDIDTREVTA